MYQNLILIGRLGTEPILSKTSTGRSVVTFRLCTRERRWRDDDTSEQLTVWWQVTLWGEKAEAVAAGAGKGDKLLIEGTINSGPDGNPRVYQLKSGEWASTYEVTARMFRFLDPPKNGGRRSSDLFG